MSGPLRLQFWSKYRRLAAYEQSYPHVYGTRERSRERHNKINPGRVSFRDGWNSSLRDCDKALAQGSRVGGEGGGYLFFPLTFEFGTYWLAKAWFRVQGLAFMN